MGLFSTKKEGGLMDIIRCDEAEYLVWKWRPSGGANSTKKENSIRFGSSLRVKEGELAVFFYKQEDGDLQDFIVGPYEESINTVNFPILTNIFGSAFGGSSPFQAEIYFINLAGNIQIRFGIPYFDVYDPRFTDLGVPCAVRGTITFNLQDYKKFIGLNRLVNFDLEDFKLQIRDFFQRKAKSVILGVPQAYNIGLMQIEGRIDEISEAIGTKLQIELAEHFGINLKRLDIGAIELDKEHPHYLQLKRATADQQARFAEAKTDVDIENLSEAARIERKEKEMEVEGKNLTVHQINQQTEVLKAAAENLGEMGQLDGNGNGMNAAGMMMGMGIGGAMGNQMGGMMGRMTSTPPQLPPLSGVLFHIALNGQQSGPFSIEQLKQMTLSGQFTSTHYVWKEGMSGWELASVITELTELFRAVPPPPPGG